METCYSFISSEIAILYFYLQVYKYKQQNKERGVEWSSKKGQESF